MSTVSERLSAAPRKGLAASAPRSARRAALSLGVGILAALMAAVVLRSQLDRSTPGVAPPLVDLVVAAADIPAGTALAPEHLATLSWPAAGMPDGAATEVPSLIGRVPRTPLVKGEAVLAAKLAEVGAGAGLAAVLPTAMRAVSVRVDDVVSVSGFVRPGDLVDVVATLKLGAGFEAPETAKVVLQRVRVLAVGRETEARPDRSEKAATVATLMVSPADAERLALASTSGKLLLALRGASDLAEAATDGAEAPALMGARRSLGGGAVRRARIAGPAPAAPVVREGWKVEILRGDKLEVRTFGVPGDGA